MIERRRLELDDFDEWYALRLRGLREDPLSFWKSPEEESEREPIFERYKQGLETGESWLIGSFEDGRLIGCAGYVRMPQKKRRHLGGVWGVYLAPEARGRGLCVPMIETLIAGVREATEVELLELGVATENVAAVRAYERCGFVTWGTEPAAIRVDGRDYDEFMMTLRL